MLCDLGGALSQGGGSRARQANPDSDLAMCGRAQYRKDDTHLPAAPDEDSTQGK